MTAGRIHPISIAQSCFPGEGKFLGRQDWRWLLGKTRANIQSLRHPSDAEVSPSVGGVEESRMLTSRREFEALHRAVCELKESGSGLDPLAS